MALDEHARTVREMKMPTPNFAFALPLTVITAWAERDSNTIFDLLEVPAAAWGLAMMREV